QEDAVSGLYIAGEVRIAGGGALAGANNRFRRNSENGTGLQNAFAALETAETDLRPLQVEQDSGVHAGFTRRCPGRVDPRGVIRLRAVRHVEPEYVDPGRKELLQNARS